MDETSRARSCTRFSCVKTPAEQRTHETREEHSRREKRFEAKRETTTPSEIFTTKKRRDGNEMEQCGLAAQRNNGTRVLTMLPRSTRSTRHVFLSGILGRSEHVEQSPKTLAIPDEDFWPPDYSEAGSRSVALILYQYERRRKPNRTEPIYAPHT